MNGTNVHIIPIKFRQFLNYVNKKYLFQKLISFFTVFPNRDWQFSVKNSFSVLYKRDFVNSRSPILKHKVFSLIFL